MSLISERDVRDTAMGILNADEEISDVFGADGVIAPANRASDALEDTGAGLILAVGVSRASASRENTAEETTFDVRVIAGGTFSYVDGPGSDEDILAIKSRAATVLTEQREGFRVEGINADEEIVPNDEINVHHGEFQAQWTVRRPR